MAIDAPAELARDIGIQVDRYLLVAGYDFTSRPDLRPFDFASLAHHRVLRLRAAHPHPAHFITIDVAKGQVRSDLFNAKSHHKRTAEIGEPILPRHLRWDPEAKRDVFITQKTNVISITDIYDLVQLIGSLAPGSLKELSFLSHSWIGGPILVNSYEQPNYKREEFGIRDPWDKDGRKNKDFQHSRRDLDKAFANSGRIWLWGCSNSYSVSAVLGSLVREYRLERMPENVVLRFSDLPGQTAELDRHFFGGVVQSEGGYILETTQSRIRRFLERRLNDSYPQAISNACSATCYAALPALAAWLDQGPLPLLHVTDTRDPLQQILSTGMSAYDTLLATSGDPENRGYTEFRPHDLFQLL